MIRQVRNVASDVFIQEAWARGQEVAVHGWVYALSDGIVNDRVGDRAGLERLTRSGATPRCDCVRRCDRLAR